MTNNRYLDEIERRYDLDDLSPDTLAALATAQELHERNRLTVALNAPLKFATNVQEPISPENLHAQRILSSDPVDSEGDARIAAAARRWAKAYGNRNMPGASPATHHLAASELLETIRQEDER